MHEARQDTKPGRPPTAISEAETFLQELLADGEKPAKEIYEAAEAVGIKKRTLDSAKAEMGVVSEKVGFGRESYFVWKLPLINTPPYVANNSCNLWERPIDCKNAENDETLENKGHEQNYTHTLQKSMCTHELLQPLGNVAENPPNLLPRSGKQSGREA